MIFGFIAPNADVSLCNRRRRKSLAIMPIMNQCAHVTPLADEWKKVEQKAREIFGVKVWVLASSV